MQEIGSDEIILPTRGGDWYDDERWVRAHRHDMKPYDYSVGNAWTHLYSGVNSCNQLIYQFEQLKKDGIGAPTTIGAYLAEVRALRALFYYWLLDTFGNVPLVTDFNASDYIATTVQRPLVFAFVEQELKEVLPLLNKAVNSLNQAFRQAGARIGKYEIRNGALPDLSNDMPIFRYADILLSKAEALWRLDNNSAEALQLVNQVRNRSNEPDNPLPMLTAQNLLAEGGREMFYEGVRRQDEIRFGIYGNPTHFMPGSLPCKELWPIPQTQLNAGANLQQNPCY